MNITKLTPAVKDNLWGGVKLRNYGKSGGDVIAETWELSFHEDGLCTLPDGRPLKDVATREDIGTNAAEFPFFPMLIKFIDAADDLSVQVHPSDAFAIENEGQFGKTEMWYVAEAEEGAGIYLGFKRDISEEKFLSAVKDGSVTEYLNFVKVKKGDHFFIRSGTVHAIGKGCTICEIQQNSNVTYRVYDYGRTDKTGKPRELHVEKASKVACLKAMSPVSPALPEGDFTRIGINKYFTVFLAEVNGVKKFKAGEGSFVAVSVTEGGGSVGGVPVLKGDTVFVPAGYGYFPLEGKMTALLSTVRKYFAAAVAYGDITEVTVYDDEDTCIAGVRGASDGRYGARKLLARALEPFGAEIPDISKITFNV